MNKKVHVYYTGGTIGMVKDNEGRYVPDPNFPARMRAALENVPGLPEWDIASRSRLLDSSNMTPKDWMEIAAYIESKYNDYTSFVILHGTDTMAYTTSAMAFMLENLRKPVIFTGSQIPLSEDNNDAKNNLQHSLQFAANDRLRPEVCLFFWKKLLRGCRSVKLDATNFDAFDSPNFPPLARVREDGIEYHTLEAEIQMADEAPLNIQNIAPTKVGLLRLFPGISAEITRNLLQAPLIGAVIHAYGSGHGPSGEDHVDFEEAIREAARRGVLVACTQCLRGNVDLVRYATGLGRLGVISGYDMTVEAALTKLFYLINKYPTALERVKEEMQKNLRGELTKNYVV